MATTDAKGVTLARVVDRAAVLVDERGWRALTMAALAKDLGVRAPSLYSHVDGLDAVLSMVQVHALLVLGERSKLAAMGTSGPACTRALALDLREFAREHPGLYDLAMSEAIDLEAMREAAGPAGAATVAMIRSYGIARPSVDLGFLCLAPLHGILCLERSRLLRHAVDVDAAYETAIETVVAMLERTAAAGEVPSSSGAGRRK
jgi:AcrR family transcriptional regulator